MPRKRIPKGLVRWYLNEWMAAIGITKQVELMARTGWSKATASALCSGEQDFSPSHLNAASQALGLEPFELLLPPERAMALRRFYTEAKQVVETGSDAALPPSVADLGHHRAKKKAR